MKNICKVLFRFFRKLFQKNTAQELLRKRAQCVQLLNNVWLNILQKKNRMRQPLSSLSCGRCQGGAVRLREGRVGCSHLSRLSHIGARAGKTGWDGSSDRSHPFDDGSRGGRGNEDWDNRGWQDCSQLSPEGSIEGVGGSRHLSRVSHIGASAGQAGRDGGSH